MTTSTICPTCGGSKGSRSAQCRHCHLTEIAPLGYQATAAKFGDKFGVQFAKAHLDKNPSDLEQIVAGWLTDLSLEFEMNYWFEVKSAGSTKVYLVDFVVYLQSETLMIEVDGEWAHQFHEERDANKTAAIESAGFPLLRMNTTAIKNGSAFVALKNTIAQ